MDFRINLDEEEIVMLSGEETGETTSSGTESNVFTFLKPQMSTSDMFMNAGIVILVVFGVLFIMYVLISLAKSLKQSPPQPQQLLQQQRPQPQKRNSLQEH